MRSRIVLDTRISPDDRVHLVVRYSKNGLAEQGADLPGELPQLSGWLCHANGSRKGCSQG
jgi:hypothetical protein